MMKREGFACFMEGSFFRSAFFICLFFLILRINAEEDIEEEEDDVLVLTDDNFDSVVNSKSIILVEFYAPWCGHCKALAPEYSKAAKTLKMASIPVPLAKVDATVHTELASRFDINSYPTLFMFRNGEKEDYDGPRDEFGIISYMKERSDPNWKPPPSAVISLTKENFSAMVDEEPIILVEFYAPWCGHCKRLAPEYENAAKQLKILDPPIPLAKVDGTVENDLVEKYQVKGWPTLKIFRKGQPFEFEGPRTASGIVSYMKDQSKSPSSEIVSVIKAKNAISKLEVTVMGFFSNSDETIYKEYITAANELRGKFIFLHTFDPEVKSYYKIKKSSVIVFQPEIFHSKFEDPKYVFDKEESSVTEIKNFIQKKSLPLVGHRTKTNMQEKYSSRPLVVVYYDVNFDFQHRTATQLVREKVVKVAKDFPQITFAVSQEEDFEDELKQLGLDESGSDINIGFFKSSSIRYGLEPDDDFESDILRKFVKSVLDGKAKQHIISQPIPEKQTGPVNVVVAKSFDKVILQNDEDVLLEFYAPWCGHCKALEPTYNKLAKKLQNRKLIVAKMDATSNDVPEGFSVSGFPTIYFLAADKKDKPILFEGSDRNIKTLIEFVDKNSFHKDETVKEEL